MSTVFEKILAGEFKLTIKNVSNLLKLLESGATIPFIARYRKEQTGEMDEVMISQIKERWEQLQEIEKRRQYILESIQSQDKLTPELQDKIESAVTLAELEDLYLPYKPKRKTRASIAKAKGLEPLALKIFEQKPIDIQKFSAQFVSEEMDVKNIDEAIAGASDIIAEWINEDTNLRAKIRNLFNHEAYIKSKVIKGKEEEGSNYKTYFDFEELAIKAPSHRILAMFRGENEEFLRVSVLPKEENALNIVEKHVVKANNECGKIVRAAAIDAYKRLLASSMENEFRQVIKEKADKEAIRVFADNVKQLLLAPPLGQKNVLAIDPGFKTGCKVVILDRQGNLLHNATIYPHPPQKETRQAANKILQLVEQYKIEAIAIGNGTAGRETESFIRSIRFNRDLIAVMVNESGASIYSASDIARKEFPDYDVTVRGAVSIGRRLMDPLAELVKIDPKSIGVGQYQHDVDQNALQKSLDEVVISAVNNVGVEVNTSSKQLLQYVSGLGPALAQNIIEYRQTVGPFKSRDELKKVPRFGEKAFEQSAGFLRIQNAENPLDSSAVHPESYHIVYKMAKDLNCQVKDLITNEELRKKINIQNYVTESIGLPTLTDIMKELAKPGRDPRKKFDYFEFDKNIRDIEDLVPGMIVPGIVTNITAFGAFVDIGIHQDGLVHLSQMANRYIKDANEVVHLNQKVMVKVLEVDVPRKRISLSLRVE